MAVLGDTSRREVWAEFMSYDEEPQDWLKGELRDALDAVDNWVNSNQASFNSALPQPFRGNASAAQKALLLQYVVARRYQDGA